MDTNHWSCWELKHGASVMEAEAHGSMYEDVFLSLNDQGTPRYFHEFSLLFFTPHSQQEHPQF